MLERSLELHISIASNGVRPVLPRRGLNPAALREADAGAVLDAAPKTSKKVPPAGRPRRGWSSNLRPTCVQPRAPNLQNL